MMPPSWKTEIEETVEKAAHSNGEWQKAENEKNSAYISAAIKSFVDAYNAQHGKPDRKDKIKRFLDVATVVLLFGTAIFTGLGWLVFRGQLGEMQRVYAPIKESADAAKAAAEAALKQAEEAHEQTVTTRAQVRANISSDTFGVDEYLEKGIPAGWEITPKWKNTGPTDALDVKSWYGIGYAGSPISAAIPIQCNPMPTPPNVFARRIQATHSFLQLAQRISMEQLQKAARGEAIIIIEGHVEYRDIFPGDPTYTINWCARLIPNDIAAKKASFIDLKMETH